MSRPATAAAGEAGPAVDRGEWFAALRANFASAVARTGRCEDRWLRIGGLNLRLRFAGEAVQPVVWPAFAHLASPPETSGETRGADLTVLLFHQPDSALVLPPPPGPMASFSPRGDMRGFSTPTFKAAFQPFGRILSALDLPAGVGVVGVGDAAGVYNFERAAPLRPMLGWFMRAHGRQLIHAGAVACRGHGVLLGGKGGSGKSNTTVACLHAGLDFLSDDFCAVTSTPTPAAFSLFGTARARAEDLERLPFLKALAETPNPLPSDKELFLLHAAYPGRVVASCALRAVFLPRIGSGPARLEPVSRQETVMALGPVTATLLPDSGGEVLANVSALVRALPCYRLHLGDDLTQVPALIREFLAQADTASAQTSSR